MKFPGITLMELNRVECNAGNAEHLRYAYMHFISKLVDVSTVLINFTVNRILN